MVLSSWCMQMHALELNGKWIPNANAFDSRCIQQWPNATSLRLMLSVYIYFEPNKSAIFRSSDSLNSALHCTIPFVDNNILLWMLFDVHSFYSKWVNMNGLHRYTDTDGEVFIHLFQSFGSLPLSFQISNWPKRRQLKKKKQRKHDATATHTTYKSNATTSNYPSYSKYAATTAAAATTPFEYVNGTAATQSHDTQSSKLPSE